MFSVLHRLFIPHHSNNYRSKILHNASLFALVLLTLIASSALLIVRKTDPAVLGVATNITVADLLNATNKEREIHGLRQLTLDQSLSNAALAKANYMFQKDFWAHNAPDGTTPWVFIQNAGYNYVFAGENLARDFNDSQSVVNAWMNSPSHRENVLNEKYEEIGFAVVNGRLSGQDTTLVVEMFGKRNGGSVAKLPAIPRAYAASSSSTVKVDTKNVIKPSLAPSLPPVPQVSEPVEEVSPSLVAGITNTPALDSMLLTKNIAIATLGIVILAFFFDMVYIERKKLFRLVGHNLDHILFLGGAILLLILFGKGIVV